MIDRWISVFFAASLALTAVHAQAQEAPDALVKRVAEDVLQTIRGDKDLQAGNQAKVKQIDRDQARAAFRLHPHDGAGDGAQLAQRDAGAAESA